MNESIKTIYSKDLENKWRETIRLENEGQTLRWNVIFSEAIPEDVQLDVHLEGVDSKAEIFFAYVGEKKTDTRMHVRFFHEAPRTYGRFTARALLKDESRLELKGNLIVEEKAKGADTAFVGKALILSPTARGEIFPYLEIKTNEVKATHGSSVGRVDPHHLFYLQTRGMQKKEAVSTLVKSFFFDPKNKDAHPLMDELFSRGI